MLEWAPSVSPFWMAGGQCTMLTFNSMGCVMSTACSTRCLPLQPAVVSLSNVSPKYAQLLPSSLTHPLLVPGQVQWPPCWSSCFFAVSHVCSQAGGWRCMVCALSDLDGCPSTHQLLPWSREREHLVHGEPRGSPSAYSELSPSFSFTSQHGKSWEPTGRDFQNIWPSLSGFLGPGEWET